MAQNAKDADVWILIWEELHSVHEEDILVEVRARQSASLQKGEKKQLQGSDKAEEFSKRRSDVEWKRCGAGASYYGSAREEVYAALQYAASLHCLVEEWRGCEELEPNPKERWTFVNKTMEARMHRMEWCAAANTYRCMRLRNKQQQT